MINSALRFDSLLPRSVFEALREKNLHKLWSVTSVVSQHACWLPARHAPKFLGIAQGGLVFKFPVAAGSIFEWYLHVSGKCIGGSERWGNETLENIPVGATLISAITYLLTALTGGVGSRGGGGGREALFTQSSVHLNQVTIRSEITVTTTALCTCCRCTGCGAGTYRRSQEASQIL